MKIEAAILGVTRLYLDTAPVIYLVERNPSFFDAVCAIFQQVDEMRLTVVASPVTLAECLVGAYGMNQPELAASFMQCLTSGETDFVPISAEIGDLAARLRVEV